MKTMKEIFDSTYLHSMVPQQFPDGWKGYSDKNTNHRYVDSLYEDLFKDIRFSAKKVLEIGIFGGGSMLLWQKYFENATIYGIDNSYFIKEFIGQERMVQIIGDAYTPGIVNALADNEFDIIIDDGPHDLVSFEFFVKNYISKVKPGGYLIIEDIFDINMAYYLIGKLPLELRNRAEVLDFRQVTNLFDEMLLVVKK